MDMIFLIVISLLFIKIAVTDYREKYIYDKDILAAAALIFVYNTYTNNLYIMVLGGIIGFITGALIYSAAYWLYKDEGFGAGDVLLITVLGLFFGYNQFYNYFTVTMFYTGIILIPGMIIKPEIKKLSIPLAPILIAGYYIFLASNRPCLTDIFTLFL